MILKWLRFYSSIADVFTPQKRPEVMSRIRGRDTKPEPALRSMLHRLGYRFTPPGKPDIVLPKHRTVIFVHGCRAATRIWTHAPKIRFVNRPRGE